MAEKVFGIAHLYGVNGSVTNATVLSFSRGKNHALEDSTEDENGRQIEERLDDVRTEGSITLRMRTLFAEPEIGTVVTYEGEKYLLMKLDESQENKGFRTQSWTMKNYEYITLP